MTELFVNDKVRSDYRGAFDDATYERVTRFFSERGDAGTTPLVDVPGESLGVRRILVKDESHRMGLGAFKGIGVLYAMSTAGISPGSTVVCASAGNHGRAVARVSRQLGCRACVYMSDSSAGPRVAAIRNEGAEVVSIHGTYDEAVARMREDADANGWVIVSDTAWPGYEETPLAIMAGYTHLMEEARQQWERAPDVVIVQAGVGGLAGAVVSWLCDRFGADRPLTICSEPVSAAPLLASARAGHSTVSPEQIQTIMAGLGCSEPSSVAVPIMNAGCHVFVAIEDDFAREAMRFLAKHGVIAGPSGAAGVGALLALRRSGIIRRDAVVMVINTEGAIDREEYESIVKT